MRREVKWEIWVGECVEGRIGKVEVSGSLGRRLVDNKVKGVYILV